MHIHIILWPFSQGLISEINSKHKTSNKANKGLPANNAIHKISIAAVSKEMSLNSYVTTMTGNKLFTTTAFRLSRAAFIKWIRWRFSSMFVIC